MATYRRLLLGVTVASCLAALLISSRFASGPSKPLPAPRLQAPESNPPHPAASQTALVSAEADRNPAQNEDPHRKKISRNAAASSGLNLKTPNLSSDFQRAQPAKSNDVVMKHDDVKSLDADKSPEADENPNLIKSQDAVESLDSVKSLEAVNNPDSVKSRDAVKSPDTATDFRRAQPAEDAPWRAWSEADWGLARVTYRDVTEDGQRGSNTGQFLTSDSWPTL